MSRALFTLLPAVAIVATLSATAEAAEVGSVRGTVVDDTGGPVPGAVVTLSGPSIAGERSAVTDADGTFRIPSVPPGTHDLLIKHDSFAPQKMSITVRLDETTTVPVKLSLKGTASDVIVVDEELPVIDTTRSAFSTELSQQYLQNTPIGRSYQSAVRTLPGVYGRIDTQNGGPSAGNPSVRGEGQYGNNYLVDGISTRDPATKTFGSNITFDAIEDIQVYTDGLPAEFGQATGMLVNVVLKDGGDEHFGSAGLWTSTDASFQPTYPIVDLVEHQEVETLKRQSLGTELSVTAGGPVIKEKLWYFAAFDGGRSNTRYEGATVTQTRTDAEGVAKLTYFVTPDLSVQYMFSGSSSLIPNYESNSQFTQESQSLYKSDDMIHTVTGRYRPMANTEVELKGTYMPSHIDTEPMSGEEDLLTPQVFNLETGQYTNNYDSFDLNTRTRLGGSLKVTQLLDVAGHHKIKAGVEGWRLTDERELIFTGPRGTNPQGEDYAGRQYVADPDNGFPCTKEANYEDCSAWTEYVEVDIDGDGESDPLGHKGVVVSGFVQDDWSPIKPLTLNLGVRVDNETLFQNAGEKVVSNLMLSPRLGVAWDVTNDSKTLVTANWGRYYDIMGNTFAEWGDTKSSFVYREWSYHEDTGTYEEDWEQDPASNPLVYCTDTSTQAYIDGLVADYGQEYADEQAELVDSYCAGGVKPYHMDKMAFGVKREILPQFALGVRYMRSNTTGLAEDIDTNLDTWVVGSQPAETKRRDYWGLEVTAEKKFDKRWMLIGSYTYSESKGHLPGQFEIASGGLTGSNGNEVGVYLDDIDDMATRQMYIDAGYGWLVDGLAGLGRSGDDAGYYGYLPYHSFHQVKLNGTYTFDFGTSLGLVYEFDSGHAWQKRGYVDLYGDYFAFPEGRGSRFMPAVHYIDFRVAHKMEMEDNRTVELSLDVFNLPDFDTPITYYENDDENFGLTAYRQSPRSIRVGLRGTY